MSLVHKLVKHVYRQNENFNGLDILVNNQFYL